MTKPEELLELADRCEREEPCRALERAMAPLVGWRKHTGSTDEFWWISPKCEEVSPGFMDQHVHIRPPEWTASIDAAKSLEPADAQEVCVRIYPRGAYVRITLANGAPVYCEVLDRPITEAMARCAAALRARAAVSCKGTGAMRSEAQPNEPPPNSNTGKVST